MYYSMQHAVIYTLVDIWIATYCIHCSIYACTHTHTQCYSGSRQFQYINNIFHIHLLDDLILKNNCCIYIMCYKNLQHHCTWFLSKLLKQLCRNGGVIDISNHQLLHHYYIKQRAE